MPYDPAKHLGRLPRLGSENYRGRVCVHWSMGIQDRDTGWLDVVHHARVRELLCHTLARYHVICPAYCLMPDHAHFLWLGTSDGSDQRRAAAHFRGAWNVELALKNRKLQIQAYDHVLRDSERETDAFATIANYIFENPVRSEMVDEWRRYDFLGAVVPGYPILDPRTEDFWIKFWRIHAKLAGEP